MLLTNPLVPFVVGLVAAVVLLVKLRLPAFLGLTIAAFFIALVTPEIALTQVPQSISEAFGDVMVSIGIPILMAAIIGKSLMDSGSAERIVRAFLSIGSDDTSDVALLASSYVLSIPVFFDNVFYLLAPIGRSMRARTGGKYPLYVSVLCAGALSAHMLIPPTPGPLAMASELNVNLGVAMLLGVVVAGPSALIGGSIYGRWIDDRLDIPLRESMGSTSESLKEKTETATENLPSLPEALAPILLPVVLIAGSTVAGVVYPEGSLIRRYASFLGSPTLVLTLSAIVAALTLYRMETNSLDELNERLTEALKSGGNIIAITAAGGTFGAMLKQAGVGQYIATNLQDIGISLLVVGWLIAAIIRIAQGSGTVAILTGASIMAPLTSSLVVDPVYMMMAVGTGGMIAPWYNDSGFWIVNQVAGITQMETFKTYSAVSTIMSTVGLCIVLLLAAVLPHPLV